jgi:hypothetical protein
MRDAARFQRGWHGARLMYGEKKNGRLSGYAVDGEG